MEGKAYYNGIVYTADRSAPTAQAFVVRDGKFSFVGSNEDVSGYEDKTDLKGKCVIPGLIDSHCHMFAMITKEALDTIHVDEDTLPGELGKVLLDEVNRSADPYRDMITAVGIDLTKGSFSAADIDCAINDRPVQVFSCDGHALLLNSCAMERIGIRRDTENVDNNSYFVRDSGGNPTGLVIEIPAMLKCRSLYDEANSAADTGKILSRILKKYASLGYTGVFEAMSADNPDFSHFEALRILDEKGALTMRISASFCYHGEDYLPFDETLQCMEDMKKYTSENFHPDTLKLISDGTVEEHSALLFEPYADELNNYGSELLPAEIMKKAAADAAAKGFSVHIHAIGDRAVSNALDALCPLKDMKGTKTIAHNQLYRSSDIERLTEAGDIFFQTTPHWTTLDEFTQKALGKERSLREFPIGTVMKNGVPVAFGSDSLPDDSTSNAFAGIRDALLNGDCAPDRMSCLEAYTINGAAQLCTGDIAGSIEAGKSADFVILDRDIMNCPIEELPDTKVLNTYFAGKQVF